MLLHRAIIPSDSSSISEQEKRARRRKEKGRNKNEDSRPHNRRHGDAVGGQGRSRPDLPLNDHRLALHERGCHLVRYEV